MQKWMIVFALLMLPSAANAADGTDDGPMSWSGITGPWAGARASMEEGGVTIEASYTGESYRNLSGGAMNQSGSQYHDVREVAITFDTEKLGAWPGGTLFVSGVQNRRGDPSGLTGDMQGVSNIASDEQTVVHEAWYQQELFDGAFSLLFGLHDLNADFYASDYAGLFHNGSFGIGPEVGGNVGTSLYPRPGYGVRARVNATENFYIQGALYDGAPDPRTFTEATDGVMGIVEAGFVTDTGAYKAGYWVHTLDVTYGANTFKDNKGAYAIIDQQVVAFNDESSLGVFGTYGWVPNIRNQINSYYSAGLNVNGPLPTRADDVFGIAYNRVNTDLDAESVIEITYLLQVTPWLAIQPSYQMISNPGGDVTVPNAKALLLRFSVSL